MVNGNLKGIEEFIKKRIEALDGAQYDSSKFLDEALAITAEDIKLCEAIGNAGKVLLKEGMGVLTHCNAGALATAGTGTALAPIYAALKDGINVKVFSDETRPLLQGARLTAWELAVSGVDVTTICDSMASQVMSEGRFFRLQA